jgi:hypothetical protein
MGRIVAEDSEWALRPNDEFDPPTCPGLGLRRLPSDGIGDLLHRALALPKAERERQSQARRSALLAVRARNRADDWERLMRS